MPAQKYPVGEFRFDPSLASDKRIALVNELGGFPASLRSIVGGLSDARTLAPEISVSLMESAHTRLAFVLRGCVPADFGRMFHHPERGDIPVEHALQSRHWHCRHHTGQIKAFCEAKGW
jgi:hypothetical protein